jgi:putative CocE/NonD family hydrolase
VELCGAHQLRGGEACGRRRAKLTGGDVRRSLCIVAVIVLLPGLAAAQSFSFRAPASPSDPATAAVMQDLASRIIPVYHDPDRERFLANLSALQLAAGTYESAYSARRALRQLRQGKSRYPALAPALIYDLYAHAMALQAQFRVPFDRAFDLAFWEAIPIFDNFDAYRLESWLERPVAPYEQRLAASFDRLRVHPEIGESEALRLIRQYVDYTAYRSFAPLAAGLVSLDDDRRYIIQNDVEIALPGRLHVQATLVRPRTPGGLQTTLLQYRILPGGAREAIEAAAYGFASVVAYTPRIRLGRHRYEVIPFEHEGSHARAVIRWIVKQPWSDDQVGMYGQGYSGFAAWAAAKHLLPALKAIGTADAIAPGVDFPMDGNIVLTAGYCWLENVQAQRAQGARQAPLDAAACRALGDKWFVSGRPYRDLPRIAGKPSGIFQRWLEHPSYDFYWRHLAPSTREFARIDVPVLSVTGYFDRGEAGALFYFLEHYRYDPTADQTLVIGPYDANEVRSGAAQPLVRGYRKDPVAVVNLRTLEFEWFSYLFFHTRQPPLIAGRVNYEMMGANQWEHAASLADVASGESRLFLAADPGGGSDRLTWHRPRTRTAIGLTVNLSRHARAPQPLRQIFSDRVPLEDGVAFVSEPLPVPLGIAGRVSGLLRLTTNKPDFDLALSLYELLPDGHYLKLFAPPEAFRASFARSPLVRHLLRPDRIEWLAFEGERLTAVRLVPGSRLVLVLRVNVRPDQQINFGTWGNVSDADAAAARIPLRLRLLGGSYLNVPLAKERPSGEPRPPTGR